MDIFKRKQKKAAKEDPSYNINKLHGEVIRYVTARNTNDYSETILGRDGTINITEDELIINCSNAIVFRQPLSVIQVSDLMSLDGFIVRHTDPATGEQKIIVAYYKYHRK